MSWELSEEMDCYFVQTNVQTNAEAYFHTVIVLRHASLLVRYSVVFAAKYRTLASFLLLDALSVARRAGHIYSLFLKVDVNLFWAP